MKSIETILVGGLVTAQFAYARAEISIPLKRLPEVGLNPEVIQEVYRQKANVNLNWEEVLKVSANEEGGEISFNTIDNISIVVPIHMASGPFNKDEFEP